MDVDRRLHEAAEQGPDVPGTPYSLRLDGVGPASRARRRLDWSYRDPTGEADRVAGSTDVAGSATPEEGWRAAQLDAAHAYKGHLDLDTRPGEPYVPLRFEADQAWRLLLDHLREWHRVTEEDGYLLVDGEHRLRTDRATWAAYLDQFADRRRAGPDENPDGWVPCAVPMAGGLPLWAWMDLVEALGAWGDCRVVGHKIVAEPSV